MSAPPEPPARSVDDYIASIPDERTASDARTLRVLLQRITDREPQLWNEGTIGFGTYHYAYASGREGDAHTIGFYPRKGKLTIYLMDGTGRHAEQLSRLGPHSTTGYCVYLKRLDDVDASVLEEVLRDSVAYIEAKAAEGPIREILWKADPS
jgi:hypothetical protein